ncbi:T-cell receptor alpha chain V region CTL-F3, partial [Pelobates cultripes]
FKSAVNEETDRSPPLCAPTTEHFSYSSLSRADSVNQATSYATVYDGDDITLNCTYETADSNPYLHWYIQQPGERPRFILLRDRYSKVETEPGTRYASKLDRETTFIYLKISDVTVSDSGLYYCALRPTVSVSADCTVQEALTLSKVGVTTSGRAQMRGLPGGLICSTMQETPSGSSSSNIVTQTPAEISAIEGSHVKFDCKYETSSSNNDLFWYSQQPGKSPRYILWRAEYVNKDAGSDSKYESKLDKETNSIYLKISDVTVSDSGVYYCALRPTVSVSADCTVQEALTLEAKSYFPDSSINSFSLKLVSSKPSINRKRPRFILLRDRYSKVETEPGTRYASKLDKDTTSTYLKISDVTVSDSRLYYCALRPTVSVSADCTVQEALTLSKFDGYGEGGSPGPRGFKLFTRHAPTRVLVQCTYNPCLPTQPSLSRGDSVHQATSSKMAEDGDEITLNCTYATASSSPYLHWYIQQPGERPRFILLRDRYSKVETEPGTRYASKLDKDTTSIYLKISDVTVSDSGVYYCALSATVSVSADCTVQEALTLSKLIKCSTGEGGSPGPRGVQCTYNPCLPTQPNDIGQQPVDPSIPSINSKMRSFHDDGDDKTLTCTYETVDSNPYLHWYIQQPGERPQFILLRHLFSSVEKIPGEKHESEVDKETKSTYLKISDVSVSDSGVYYCALRPTVSLSADCTVQEAHVSVPDCTVQEALTLFFHLPYYIYDEAFCMILLLIPGNSLLCRPIVQITEASKLLQNSVLTNRHIGRKGLSRADSVNQATTTYVTFDGDEITLNCTYETADSNPYLHWYIQQPGERPRFILLRDRYSKVETEPGTRYASKLDRETTFIYLKISDVTVSDSGLYYCALRPTVSVSADCTVQEALTLSKVLIHVSALN